MVYDSDTLEQVQPADDCDSPGTDFAPRERMSRLHYYAALTFLVASLFALVRNGLARSRPELVMTSNGPTMAPRPAPAPGARGWFQSMKPFCNTVEAEVALRNNPPPEGNEGAAYAAACLAPQV